jgi:hypothetical protein
LLLFEIIKASSAMKQLQKIGAPLSRKEQRQMSGGIDTFPLCGTGQLCGLCINIYDDALWYRSCTTRCQQGYRFWCYFP